MCFERLLDPTAEGKALRRQLEELQEKRMKPMTGGSGQDFWKVRIELGPDFAVRDLEQDTRIDTDPDGINRALSETPRLIAWWGRAENIARQLLDQAKGQLDLYEAELYKIMPGRIEAAGSKPTVDAIRAWIISDETRQQLYKAVQGAEHNLGILIIGRQTMVHKKDTAIEIARNMRAEMDYDLKVGKERLVGMYTRREGGKE